MHVQHNTPETLENERKSGNKFAKMATSFAITIIKKAFKVLVSKIAFEASLQHKVLTEGTPFGALNHF